MSDSVGKISLDLEVTSDLVKQISAVSNAMGKKLKDTMDSATKSMFDGMDGNMNKSMQSMSSTLKSGLNKMKQNIRNTFSSGLDVLKNIKMPTASFPKMNILKPKTSDVTSQKTTRGPPTFNTEALRAQIDNVGKTLDTTNAKIEQQQSKLAALKQEYASAFNHERKNKLEEQILKTESSINKLIGTSDKLGFKLAELDEKFAMAGAEAKAAGKDFNTLETKTKSLGNNANKTNVPTKGLFNSLKNLGNSAKTSSNHLSNHNSQIKMIARSMFTWGIIFPMVLKGLQAMGSGLLADLNTNTQFANSLAQIKTNLSVAFTPIFYAILPAINALMSALATITTYIASFISSIFGKTYQQSFQATQGLINAKEAMGAYGDSAKKAAKDSRELAGFDEINKLSSNKDSGGAGSGAKSKVPTLVQPSLNTSTVDSKMQTLADKFKRVLGTIFQPFRNAWAKDGAGVMNEFGNAVDGTKGTLKNFFNMLATPPVQLFIENIARIGLSLVKLALKIYDSFILPIVNWFISILPGAANGMNPILGAVRKFVDYLSGDGFKYVQGFIPVVLGIVVAIKTFSIVLNVATWFKNLIPVIRDVWLLIAANPIGLVIAAIAGLVFAFGTLYASNESFRNKVNEVCTTISNLFAPILGTLKTALLDVWNNALVPLGKTLMELGNMIIIPLAKIFTDIFGIAIKVILSILKDLWNLVLVPLGSFIKDIFVKIIQSAIEIFHAWKPGIQLIIDIMMFLWNYVLRPIISFIGGTFVQVFRSTFASVSNSIGNIKTIFSGIIDFVTGVFTGNWSKAWQGVKDIFKGIFNSFGNIVKTPLNAVIGFVNGVIDGLNNFGFDLPSIMGGGHIGIGPIHNIPYLARGGIVDSPTLAMVGEAGKEAVMPLENNTGWIDSLASKLMDRMPQQQGGDSSGGSDRPIELVLQIDNTKFGKAIVDSYNKLAKQEGRILLNL